jgi:hypothetical protein
MNSVFMSELDKFIIVFIDDIILYSKSMEEDEEHLRILLQRHESTNCMPSSASVSFGSRKYHS